jgi:hypothetical protein
MMIPDGIPRIIHQTWKTAEIPEGMGDSQSWRDKNPNWEYRFWSDDDLTAFFQNVRPDLLDLFLSYPKAVQKADLARYCILYEYGGVYADIDTRCNASLDVLFGDKRVVLCEEPPEHWEHAHVRGMTHLLFNGTMASPAKHPFWKSVIDLCCLMQDRRHFDVLETTGPLLLTAAADSWPTPADLALNSCGLFASQNVHGETSETQRLGAFGHLTLSTHLWAGSWYSRDRVKWWHRKRARLRQARSFVFGGARLNPDKTLRELDQNQLSQNADCPAEDGDLLVLIPVKDAEVDLPRCFELLMELDHPRDKLHIRFGHGNSDDKSALLLQGFVDQNQGSFASLGIVNTLRNAPALKRHKRWHANIQRSRRAGIAKARNDLLDASLTEKHDWVLWIDADVTDYPPDIVRKLSAAQGRIVVPNCVLKRGGASFDLNSFLNVCTPSRVALYRQISRGLLQPPKDWFVRRHLHDLRYLDKVPLYGIGGTMILIDANCHRAGIRFPELPYRHLIETEGLGAIASDAGITPYGLPKVEIVHASS